MEWNRMEKVNKTWMELLSQHGLCPRTYMAHRTISVNCPHGKDSVQTEHLLQLNNCKTTYAVVSWVSLDKSQFHCLHTNTLAIALSIPSLHLQMLYMHSK